MKKIKIFILLFMFLFISKVQSKGLYLKVELPIYKKYKDLNKKEQTEYKKYAKILTDTYGIGLGYSFSDYVETEIIFDQMKYLYFSSTEEIGMTDNSYRNANNAIKDTDRLTRAETRNNGTSQPRGYCSNNPHTFLTKQDVCGTPPPNQSTIERYKNTAINMKLQTLITALKFKAPTKSRITPYITLGVGVSRMKIDEKNENLNENKTKIVPVTLALKNKTSFAYRVGVGTKIKISSKVYFELSARYFDYGKYKLSNDVSKKITGHDFSAGVILGF